MKKRLSKMMTVAVLVALAATTACGNRSDSKGNTSGPGTGQSSKPAGQESKGDPVKIRVMANHNQANISQSDKKWIEQVEKALNVDLEFDIPPSSGYTERLQLTLASGDYPDLIYFPNLQEPSFHNAVKDGLVVPVNKYIQHAKNIMEYTYDVSWGALKALQDDNIYGIPRTTAIRNDGYWLRKDWLNHLGIAIPDNSEITIDQFTDILRRFTNDDPDNNGQKDTHGLAAFADSKKVLQPVLTSQFGALGWQKASGGDYTYMDAMYDRNSDAYKKALQYTAMLSSEGLLDPDAPINTTTTAQERFWRGITGVLPGFAGHYAWHSRESKKINPNAELTYVFVKNEQGEVKGTGYGVGIWGFWALTSAAKNPQKVIDVLDYYLSDEAYKTVLLGYDGIDYLTEGGKKVAVPDPEEAPIRRNTMRRAGDTQIFFSVLTPKEEIDLVNPWLKKSLSSIVMSKHIEFTPNAAKKPAFLDYKKKWDETIMRINLGQSPVSSFDEMLKGWYANGGDQYVKEMNEFITTVEAAK